MMTTNPPDTGQDRRRILLTFSGLLLCMLLASLDQTVMATALPTIAGQLGGFQDLPWIVTAYLLTSTASTPLWGKIGDLYGRKQVMLAAITVFLMGSVLCGVAWNLISLILFRGLQGVGAGGVMVMAMTVVGDIISPRERGKYQGYIQSVFAIASVGGPFIGGVFVDTLSWRWVFYVNLPIGLAALVLIGLLLPAPQDRRKSTVDYIGAALLVAVICSLLLITVWGGQKYAWGSTPILSLAATTVILGAVLVWWERRVEEPVLPLSMLRLPVVQVVSVTLFLVTGCFFTANFFLPTYLQVVLHDGATTSGIQLLPMLLSIILATTVSGRLVTKTGRYKIFPVIGTALIAIAMFLFSRLDVDTSRALLTVYMVIMGIGFGLISQILIVAVQNAVPRMQLGTATASTNFFRSLGGSIGVAVFGAIFGAGLSNWLPKLIPSDAAPGIDPQALLSTPEQIRGLSEEVREGVARSVVESLSPVYLTGCGLAVVAFLVVLFLKEVPLSERPGAPGAGKGGADKGGDKPAESGASEA